MTYTEALEIWKTRKRMVQMQCETCWGQDGDLAIEALKIMAEKEKRTTPGMRPIYAILYTEIPKEHTGTLNLSFMITKNTNKGIKLIKIDNLDIKEFPL